MRAVCENSLPQDPPLGWLEENVEVMFVAIVIALGLRAYYLQPFRIPTGSMQPTLNGIVGKPLPEAKWPGFPQRVMEFFLRGRSYVQIVNDQDRHVAISPQGRPDIRDTQIFHFFSRSELHFVDSTPLPLPAPTTPCFQTGLQAAIQAASRNGGLLPKGTVLCEGTIDSRRPGAGGQGFLSFPQTAPRRGVRLRHPRHPRHRRAQRRTGQGLALHQTSVRRARRYPDHPIPQSANRWQDRQGTRHPAGDPRRRAIMPSTPAATAWPIPAKRCTGIRSCPNPSPNPGMR